jgi:hypothetical protein
MSASGVPILVVKIHKERIIEIILTYFDTIGILLVNGGIDDSNS